MSSGCGDVLSLADLQTAKKHQLFEAEVITGKSGGVAGGADIDYATNQATWQVQKTMPAIMRDAGLVVAEFDFTTGGTLAANDRNKAVLWPSADGGNGAYYIWKGGLPKTIPASSSPYTTGGVSGSAWAPVAGAGFSDITLSTITDVSGTVAWAGTLIRVSDTNSTFKVYDAPSSNSRLPLITTSNGRYLLPEDADWGRMLSNLKDVQTVAEFEAQGAASSSHQGYEIDNATGRVFLTLDNGGAGKTNVYEYTLSPTGGVGSLVAGATDLPGGHGDYFIIQRDPSNGDRYLWMMELKDYAPNNMHNIVRVKWNGASTTAADVDIRIPFSDVSRPEISWFGMRDDVVIRDTNTRMVHICSLESLLGGSFDPYKSFHESQHTTALAPGLARQNFKFHGDGWSILSGGSLLPATGQTNTVSWLGVGEWVGADAAVMNLKSGSATTAEEPEGVAWAWIDGKFRTMVSSRVASSGDIKLYSASDATADVDEMQHWNGSWRDRKASASGWQHATDMDSNRRIRVPGLAVGGLPSSGGFDPENLVMYQALSTGGRQQAVLTAFGNMQMQMYGTADSTYANGAFSIRNTATTPGALGVVVFHMGGNGIGVGTASPNALYQMTLAASSLSGLLVNGGAANGVISNSSGIDFGVPAGTAMTIGSINASTGAVDTNYFTIDNTSIRPNRSVVPQVDNAYTLGSSGARYSTVYAVNGTIQTSDATKKKNRKAISDAVLDAWDTVEFCQYEWADGEDSRTHFGVIAQEVVEKFSAFGINALDTGVVTFEDGVYGVSYAEAMVLEMACMRRKLNR